MSTSFKMIGSGAAVALAFILTGVCAWGDDLPSRSADDAAKIHAEAAKPSAEHTKLDPLAGSWTYTGKFWMTPNQAPVEMKGTVERDWVLGGRFLEAKYAGTGFDGKPGFEGRGLIGYDNGQKNFTLSFVSNQGTGTCNGLGVSDASGTFTFQTQSYCPIAKKIVTGREVIRIEASDKIVHESYINEDGKERKVMECVSVRRD